jgi:mannosyltransferase
LFNLKREPNQLISRWTELKFNLDSGLQYWLLGFIVLLAALLRFYKLGEWSFWVDEISTINRAQIHYGNLEAALRNVPPAKFWIPFSTIATSVTLNMLGVSEWSARLVSTIIGILFVPILYFSTKRLYSPSVGLLAALFLAISPGHIYWSQNARFYTSLMVFSYFALFTFFYGVERKKSVYFFYSFLFLYIAMSERLVALLLVPVLGVYLLLLETTSFGESLKFQKRKLAPILLPGIAFGLFEIYSFVTTGSSFLIDVVDNFTGDLNQSLYSPHVLLYMIITYQIGIPISYLGFFGGLYLLTQRSRRDLFIFLSAVVPVVLLVMISPVAAATERYIFFTLPFWLILSAVALKEMYLQANNYAKLLPLGVAGLVITSFFSANFLYYKVQHGNRHDWKKAFVIIQEYQHDDDLVVTNESKIADYYLDDEVKPVESITPATVQAGNRRVWFILWQIPGDLVLGPWLKENAELIEVVETPARITSRNLHIYLFDPAREPVFEGQRVPVINN